MTEFTDWSSATENNKEIAFVIRCFIWIFFMLVLLTGVNIVNSLSFQIQLVQAGPYLPNDWALLYISSLPWIYFSTANSVIWIEMLKHLHIILIEFTPL